MGTIEYLFLYTLISLKCQCLSTCVNYIWKYSTFGFFFFDILYPFFDTLGQYN